jgi:hypothetical protein
MINEELSNLDQFTLQYLNEMDWTFIRKGVVEKTSAPQVQSKLVTFFINWKNYQSLNSHFVLTDTYMEEGFSATLSQVSYFEVCRINAYYVKNCSGMTSIQAAYDYTELLDTEVISISLL